jgi:hypothetical protein
MQLNLTPKQVAHFWSRVQKFDSCWLWTGALHDFGYGDLRVASQHWHAHCLVYTLTYGPIPKGMCVCHSCDMPPCCNPEHLFLATRAGNLHDMWSKGRGRSGISRVPVPEERRARGLAHGRYTMPERTARGDRNGSRLHPERLARGERSGSSRLTEAQVRAIRTRYASGGVSYRQLSQEYGVVKTAIAAVVKRQNWQHVAI